METAIMCPTSTATILACKKIAKSFKENIYELSRIRKDWSPEYASSLCVWIKDTIEKFYSDNPDVIYDSKYREWHEVMVAGLQSLKVIRASIKVDFKNDKTFLKETLQKLGYNDYYSEAKNGDHLSLYKLLNTFTDNLDEQTRIKITDKGIPESLFTKIYDTEQQIQEFRCCIEALETDNELNTIGLKEVAEIYELIQDICLIAAAYYHFDPAKRDEFNFYKVMVNL